MGESVSILSAFIAGVISFLSPCVLPLIPAYISFITGYDLEQLTTQTDRRSKLKIIYLAIGFVVGFSMVFILLGASATFIGRWLTASMAWISKLAGLLIIVFGIHLTGIFRIPFLMQEQRYQQHNRSVGMISAFLMGAAFAFGWSPCIGPLLAGILALASTKESVHQGILLLSVYSLGLGIPFILTAALMSAFVRWLQRFKKYLIWVERLAGVLLIVLGLLLMFGQLMHLTSWFGFMMKFSI